MIHFINAKIQFHDNAFTPVEDVYLSYLSEGGSLKRKAFTRAFRKVIETFGFKYGVRRCRGSLMRGFTNMAIHTDIDLDHPIPTHVRVETAAGILGKTKRAVYMDIAEGRLGGTKGTPTLVPLYDVDIALRRRGFSRRCRIVVDKVAEVCPDLSTFVAEKLRQATTGPHVNSNTHVAAVMSAVRIASAARPSLQVVTPLLKEVLRDA